MDTLLFLADLRPEPAIVTTSYASFACAGGVDPLSQQQTHHHCLGDKQHPYSLEKLTMSVEFFHFLKCPGVHSCVFGCVHEGIPFQSCLVDSTLLRMEKLWMPGRISQAQREIREKEKSIRWNAGNVRRRGREEIASLCVPRKSARDELPPIFSPTKRVGLAPVVTEESSDSASEGPNGEESTVLTRTRQQPAKHQKALAKSPTTSVDRLLSTRANKAVLEAHHSPRVQII